jgi:phosphoribosylformimino-5-aminoimidazole carboxamide ribonucleotide (ProFAR) isomerase
MNTGRTDYNYKLEELRSKIGEKDEPVFIVRAADIAAPAAVEAWAAENTKQGGHPYMSLMAKDQAAAMRKWQKEHGCKVADMPEEPKSQTD